MFRFLIKIILLLIILAAFVLWAQAQIGAAQNSVFIELRQNFDGPQKDFPGPNENYEARLLSAVFDPRSANFTWFLNGRIVSEGAGANSYNFNTGELGSTINLRAVAVIDGIRYEASRALTVNDIDLLWRAETLVPKWYKGKALASPGSTVVITAFPNVASGARKLSNSNLIYRWSLDGQDQPEISGLNRRSIILRASNELNLPQEITLKVSNADQTIGAQKTMEILLVNPEIVFYEEHALEGPISNLALERISMSTGEEKEFRSSPYFFSQGETFTREWRIDGEKIEKNGSEELLRLRVIPEASGFITVENIIQNIKSVFQQARATLIINVR